MDLSYAIVTPVRDEVSSLERLASCVSRQTVLPRRWEIVDTGSTDGTLELAEALAHGHDWIRVTRLPGFPTRERGVAVVSALEAGFTALEHTAVDVVAKVDADVTVGETHFANLLKAFADDPHLGMASGRGFEPMGRGWTERRVTNGSVQPQCRAYRSACLEALRPLEAHVAWDGIDEVKAAIHGWRVAILDDLHFKHHRAIGAREGALTSAWWRDGVGAYYMGYRPSYLILRAVYRAFREPSSLALIPGFLWSEIQRAPRCPDVRVIKYLRAKQALRRLPARASEVLGLAPALRRRTSVDLLLVADPGGHLFELAVGLREVWRPFSRLWVTVPGPGEDVLPANEDVVFAHGPTERSLTNLCRNLWVALRLFLRFRPDVVLTTGSALAVPFAWIGRVFRAQVVYVECSGRIGLSWSCRLAAPAVTRLYVQWPEAASHSRARYAGSTLPVPR